ncbi:nucleotide-sugar transporter-domain-containing protein [Thamnocephalis sphaerospora]|uniref:Nucleotide-sugar transporter-domain-containing protein n=1 Tax=Thamnocephalis sphaerospora TaxID=78915 RepID=A0A4P9XN71_9FUNG|nr:nucleotide-sugar transporter-domain-containing protein [Thamnocephalis sphaerospora]|eukprot:RKP06760.1 nucleotide-sugar transporter-domain-containing protein [Thamnocephalis sphaerospora]
MYIASTAVVFVELVKLLACAGMIWWQSRSWRSGLRTLYRETIRQPHELLLMAVPSAIYAVQNNLLYVALSNLDATTFQVVYQLKILATALFSVILLGRRLDSNKWQALGLLMVGVIMVQLHPTTASASASPKPSSAAAAAAAATATSPLLGFLAVVTACILSGFAGCYFERVLKSSDSNIWVRNIQLCMSGVFFALVAMFVQDRHAIASGGILQGYTNLTWAVIGNQALGGLLVAVVVKYADNILKGFATSISIVLSGIVSYLLFGFQPSFLFLLGTAVVIGASLMYGRKPSTSKENYEKRACTNAHATR